MLVRQNRLAIQPKTSPLQPDSSSLQVTRIQMMIVVWEEKEEAGLGWGGLVADWAAEAGPRHRHRHRRTRHDQ